MNQQAVHNSTHKLCTFELLLGCTVLLLFAFALLKFSDFEQRLL